MGFFKMKVTKFEGKYQYPVDINKITGARYRVDSSEVACQYPADDITHPDVTQIVQAEYDQYGFVSTAIDKNQIAGDGIDTATITATVPSDDELKLIVDGQVQDIKTTINCTAEFQITADSSLIGRLLEIRVESLLWLPSEGIYLEVV